MTIHIPKLRGILAKYIKIWSLVIDGRDVLTQIEDLDRFWEKVMQVPEEQHALVAGNSRSLPRSWQVIGVPLEERLKSSNIPKDLWGCYDDVRMDRVEFRRLTQVLLEQETDGDSMQGALELSNFNCGGFTDAEYSVQQRFFDVDPLDITLYPGVPPPTEPFDYDVEITGLRHLVARSYERNDPSTTAFSLSLLLTVFNSMAPSMEICKAVLMVNQVPIASAFLSIPAKDQAEYKARLGRIIRELDYDGDLKRAWHMLHHAAKSKIGNLLGHRFILDTMGQPEPLKVNRNATSTTTVAVAK